VLSKQYFTGNRRKRTVPNSCCYLIVMQAFALTADAVAPTTKRPKRSVWWRILPVGVRGRGCPDGCLSVWAGFSAWKRGLLQCRRHAAVAYRREISGKGEVAAHCGLPSHGDLGAAAQEVLSHPSAKVRCRRQTSRSFDELARTSNTAASSLASRPAAPGHGARSQVRDQDHQR